MLYAHDTTIFWIIAGEVAAEAHHVLTAVSAIFTEHGCSRLSAHLEKSAAIASLLAESATDDVLQTILNIFQCGRLADALLDDLGWELTHHHSIFQFRLHETWLDHLTTIGNGIIEGKGADRRQHCNIADAHPRQVGLAPVAIVVFRMRNTWLTLAYKREIERNAYALTMQTFNVCCGIVTVSLIDDSADTNIAAIS